MALTSVVVGLVRPTEVVAQVAGADTRMPTVERRVEVTYAVPAWLALPASARVETGDGLIVTPLRNSGLSYENIKVGVLVGALHNQGRCAKDVTVRLQYTDDSWQPVGAPLENEARISDVEAGGLIPYRFRLQRREEFTTAPTGYVIQVTEQGRPLPTGMQWVTRTSGARPAVTSCPEPAVQFSVATTPGRTTRSGYRVSGTVTVESGGPVRPDGVTLTALVLDKDDQVLEVLTGVPDVDEQRTSANAIATGESRPFTLASPIPIGRAAVTVRVFPEVLPGARPGAVP